LQYTIALLGAVNMTPLVAIGLIVGAVAEAIGGGVMFWQMSLAAQKRA
jgi:hypothetical protein